MLRMVIPTFNRSQRLSALLAELEVVACDKRIELVVVDDFSALVEREKVQQLSLDFPKVQFLFLDHNVGGGGARNAGAQVPPHVRWLWFFDDDDYVSSETVLSILNKLEAIDEEKLVFLGCRYVSRTGVTEVVPQGSDLQARLARYGQEINTSCVIFPCSLFSKINGWDEELVAGQDTDIFLRASFFTDAEVLDDHFVEMHFHEQERVTTNPRKQMLGKLQFIRKHWKNLHWRRLGYYLVTFLTCYPFIKKWLSR